MISGVTPLAADGENGLPGVNCIIVKVSAVTPSNVGTKRMIREIAYRSMGAPSDRILIEYGRWLRRGPRPRALHPWTLKQLASARNVPPWQNGVKPKCGAYDAKAVRFT